VGYYAESIGNFLPTFLDNLPFPSSVLKNPKESLLPYQPTENLTVGGDLRKRKLSFEFLTIEDGNGRLSRKVGK
jgi:hypothetical protein